MEEPTNFIGIPLKKAETHSSSDLWEGTLPGLSAIVRRERNILWLGDPKPVPVWWSIYFSVSGFRAEQAQGPNFQDLEDYFRKRKSELQAGTKVLDACT